jgi:two-component system, sporulation sensor kinase E
MYYDLLINIIVVLLLCGVVIMMDLSIPKKYAQYIIGVMFGLITILAMTSNIMVVEGRFFDFRHITMTMAGFIGGPVSALIAAIISSLYRYNVGGSGSFSGIITIIIFACIGSILGRHYKSRQNGKKVLFWFFIGIIMALILIFIIAFIPPLMNDSVKVLSIITGPFLIITPLATTLIFNYYYWAYEFFGKASMLNTILNSGPINLIIFDANGPMLVSKNLKKLHLFSQYIENPTLLLSSKDTLMNTMKQQAREIVTEDGRSIVADLACFQMPNGEYACAAIVNDVTDQKKEQEALKAALERFSKAFQLGPHMMTIFRKSDYRYVDVNCRFLETKGLSREEVIGKKPTEIGVSESEYKQCLEAMEANGSIQNYEVPMIIKDGSERTVMLSSEKIQIDDQECILVAYNDVTNIKRMQMETTEQLTKNLKLEEDLARNNQLISDIINNMQDGFYVLDNQWNYTYVNKKVEELEQKTREELMSQNCWDLPNDDNHDFFEPFHQAMKDGVPTTFETSGHIQQDKWYQVRAYPSQFGLSVFYTDITQRKLSDEKLIKSQEEKASILESMTDCFFAIDRNWQFTYINRPGEIAFGKSHNEMLGRKITEVFEVDDIALRNYQQVMNEQRPVAFEIISESLGNKWLAISAYPTETGMTCYFRDITHRKTVENDMARLDRLHLVGQLAAGIGHEIRNPMTTVRGYLQLLGAKPEYVDRKSTFELMISELDRANSIITEFLSLAQLKQTDLISQDLNELMTKLYPLLEADAFNQNKQIYFIPGEIPNLDLNGKEINQLILNLARNGLEAMGEKGCLTVKSYLQDGKVVFAISDEGCGIPPENLRKVGTPFFTTKDYGTGLGLATCYKIVQSHNAKIDIDSSPRGTTFFIYFPISDRDKEEIKKIV